MKKLFKRKFGKKVFTDDELSMLIDEFQVEDVCVAKGTDERGLYEETWKCIIKVKSKYYCIDYKCYPYSHGIEFGPNSQPYRIEPEKELFTQEELRKMIQESSLLTDSWQFPKENENVPYEFLGCVTFKRKNGKVYEIKYKRYTALFKEDGIEYSECSQPKEVKDYE